MPFMSRINNAGLQQDLAQAFDPATGQVDNAKVLQALMRRDPATGIKFMQQKRLEDQQQAALAWLAGEQAGALPTGTGTGGGPAPTTGAGGISPQARKDVLIGGLLSGNLGGAAMKLGELQQQAYLQDYTRGQELINVTDPQTGAVYQAPRGQVMPGQAQPIPSGQPAPPAGAIPSGQPAPPVQPIPTGQPALAGGEESRNGVTRSQWNTWSREQKTKFIGGLKADERSDFVNWAYQTPQTPGGTNIADFPLGEVMRLTPEQRQRVFQTLNPSDQQRLITALQQPGNDALTIGQVLQSRPSPPSAPQPVTPPVVSGPSGIPSGPVSQAPPPVTKNAADKGIPFPPPPDVQIAQAPGGPVTDAGSPGILVKRPPVQEQIERGTIEQQFKREEEQRAEKTRLAAEQRAGPNKLMVAGEEAWIETKYKPLLLEQKTTIDKLDKLSLMERLNQKGLTGPGAPFWQGVKAFLNAAGVPASVIDVTPEQELVAQSNNLVWDTLAQQKGPQTDNDFKRMQAIWPNLQNTPEANQFLIDSSRAILNRRQRQIDFYRKNYQEYARRGTPSALDDAWNATPEAQRSVWDELGMKRWADKYGGAGGTQAPGTPGASAPPAAGGGKTFDQQAVIDLAKKTGRKPAEIRQSLEAKGYIYAP